MPPAPPNRSSPIRAAGSSRNRSSRSASAVPIRRRSWAGPRTGGNVVNRLRSNGSSTVCHCAQSASHAAPSPGWCASSAAAVRSGSRCSTAAAAAVRAQRMGEDAGRVRPPQTVSLQLQRAQRGRDRGERVERAEPVGDESRVALRGPDGAAQIGLRLEQQHVPTGVGEHGGRHQAVMTAPDDDRVHLEDGHTYIVPLTREMRRPPRDATASSQVLRPERRERDVLADGRGHGRPVVGQRDVGAGPRLGEVVAPEPAAELEFAVGLPPDPSPTRWCGAARTP